MKLIRLLESDLSFFVYVVVDGNCFSLAETAFYFSRFQTFEAQYQFIVVSTRMKSLYIFSNIVHIHVVSSFYHFQFHDVKKYTVGGLLYSSMKFLF